MIIEKDNWFDFSEAQVIDSPALLIYKARVEHNIKLGIEMLGNDPARLRPHVKTYKNREVTKMLLDRGVSKFKCATIAEAEMLAQVGCEDILLAYPLTQIKLNRFINLILTYPNSNFSCLFDSFLLAENISLSAVQNNIKINCFLDLNVGMNRTGIIPGESALQLFKQVFHLPGILLKGFHVYDGHIRMQNFESRTVACNNAFEKVVQMQTFILNKYEINLNIVVGGSATFPIHAKRPGVECSPGTFIFWDWGYSKILTEQKFQTAALVLTRVISIIDENTFCIDLGHKSIAAETILADRCTFLGNPDLISLNQNEEHLVLYFPKHSFKIGDILYALPGHICPTCALYQHANVIEDNKLIDHWKIVARDRVLTI